MTFDLLTWISIGVIYSSRTIYLPSLKLLGQSVLELSVAQGEVDWHDLDLLTWISIGVIYSSRTIYLPSLKLLGQSVLELSVAQGEVDWHDLWPTDLNINRGHLLMEDYLPTKFEASGTKHSWVISCTRLRDTDIPTDRHVQINMPLLFQRGLKYCNSMLDPNRVLHVKFWRGAFQTHPDLSTTQQDWSPIDAGVQVGMIRGAKSAVWLGLIQSGLGTTLFTVIPRTPPLSIAQWDSTWRWDNCNWLCISQVSRIQRMKTHTLNWPDLTANPFR